MNTKKHQKERFEHRRGSGTGDGKRFESIKAQERPTISLRVPGLTETDDAVESMMYQAIKQGISLTEQMKTILNQDGKFERDRFRPLIIQAINEGNLKVLSDLSLLSLFNTMRITMMETERYLAAFSGINPELTLELSRDDSPYILFDPTMLDNNMQQQFRRMMKRGQLEFYTRITVEGIRFSIYKAAEK